MEAHNKGLISVRIKVGSVYKNTLGLNGSLFSPGLQCLIQLIHLLIILLHLFVILFQIFEPNLVVTSSNASCRRVFLLNYGRIRRNNLELFLLTKITFKLKPSLEMKIEQVRRTDSVLTEPIDPASGDNNHENEPNHLSCMKKLYT